MKEGYKIFNKGLINWYGMKFEENHIYKINLNGEELKYGNNGTGIHFAKRLEDCLRYYDGLNKEIDIAKVVSLGYTVEYSDEYYGYYDLYATDKILIKSKITREEIIKYGLDLSDIRVLRFIQGFKLNELEKELFKLKFKSPLVNKYIAYYQDKDEDVFKIDSKIKIKK